MYDLIGDIHGYADTLESLLKSLGYSKVGNTYRHPERKIIFLGDYIDRGPKIRETLHIVRNMVEGGQAIALMGNHEYNAIGLNTKSLQNEDYLRPRTSNNVAQHQKTMESFQGHEAEYQSFLKWFMQLPLFYENDSFRTVHACWDHDNINQLKTKIPDGLLTEALLHESHGHSDFGDALNETIKGKEVKLPNGKTFIDVGNHVRSEIRYKWWEPVEQVSYRQLSIEEDENMPDEIIEPSLFKTSTYYLHHEKPVFFGHYWLSGEPYLFRDNICCLDFSVAKGGHLTAYRFNGEEKLHASNLQKVSASP